MQVWLKNLVNNLRDRQVAILHGNLRDCYIDGPQDTYENLTALLCRIGERLSREIPFTEIAFYDRSDYEVRRVPLRREAGPAATESADDDGADDDLFTDGYDEDAPPSPGHSSATSLEPMEVLHTWQQDLCNPRESRIAVLYYLDKIISYSSNYQDDERKLLLLLEKIIDKITPNNRLILVALRDTLVPVELYTSAPKAFVHSIPMPDADARGDFFRHRLDDLRGRPEGLTDDVLKKLGGLTDGLFLRDLENIARRIRRESDLSAPNLKRILNQYRFGDQKDYFGQLDIARIDGIVDWFERGEGVKGQTEALEKIRDVLTIARAGLSGVASGTDSKPKGVLFFAGPTGVGKTFVAKKMAKFLFGDEGAFLRFDMSEFQEEHTVSKLIGSPPGYVGSEQGGMLTNGVREKPFSVVLFDEIEKAHTKIMDIFLQILDEGRLTDSRGQTVFFTETIIVYTSNIGTRSKTATGTSEREPLEQIRNDSSLSPEEKKTRIRSHFRAAVEEFFQGEISRPELLNRFGNNIIPFNYIDDTNTQVDIFDSHLVRIKGEVEDRHRERKQHMLVNEQLANWLANQHGERLASMGGRGITNCLQDEAILPLSKRLIYAEYRGRSGVTFELAPPAGGTRLVVKDDVE